MHIYRKRPWLLTHDADECFQHVFEARRYSFYLLYWYKGTDTDAGAAGGRGTKGQKMIQKYKY
jgi:hypothetical protein